LKKETEHPKGHNCPDGQVYSNKAGKCITPKPDDEESLNEYSEDPQDRNKIPTKSLKFQSTKGRVQGVPQENKNMQKKKDYS